MHCLALHILIFITTLYQVDTIIIHMWPIRKMIHREIVQSTTPLPSPKIVPFASLHPFLHIFPRNAFPGFLMLASPTPRQERRRKEKWRLWNVIFPCPFVIKEEGRWPKWHLGICLFPKKRDVSFSPGSAGKSLTGFVEKRPDFAHFSGDIVKHGVARDIQRACKNWFQYVNCNWQKFASYLKKKERNGW